MRCPRCGLDHPAGRSRCRRCGTALQPAGYETLGNPSAPGQVDRADLQAPGGGSRPRTSIPTPPRGFRVEEADGVLRITRRWFWPATVGLFCLLAPYFLWLGITRSSTLPTILGLVFVYGLALFLFNRTVIVATADQVAISHGPIPSLLRPQVVAAREIDQLFCDEDTSPTGLGGSDIEYELKARMVDGRTVLLLSDIPDLAQARFLEQKLGERLGLTDQRVSEGYPQDE